MKNVFKSKLVVRFFSMVVAITMLMVPTVALASEVHETQSMIQPRWSYLCACDNWLGYASDISSGIMIYGSTEVYQGDAEVEVQLQKWNSTAERWDNTAMYWIVYDSERFAEAFEDNISVPAGVYRLSLIHTAYSDDRIPLESFTSYSNELTVRSSN